MEEENDKSVTKDDVFLSIERNAEDQKYYVSAVLRTGQVFLFPLLWMIFGSATSTDCDLIVWVPWAFIELKSRPDIYNKMCELLDKLMGPIIGTRKVINSSIGFWEDGVIKWAQKGSDLGEVNNSIKRTFDNHPDLQLLRTCPLTVDLPRDVWFKIQTTIRDILCKMNKSRFVNNSVDLMHQLIVSILNILEITKLSKSDKKKYVCPLLQGVFIQPVICDELCLMLPELAQSIRAITVTAENKRDRLRPIDTVVSLMEQKKSVSHTVMSILEANAADGERVRIILEALDRKSNSIPVDQYERCRKILSDLFESGVIRLNRIIRIVRRIQCLGVRMDCLCFLDLINIDYAMSPVDLADRYKDMAFKLGQALALMDGVEVYDKAEIAERYPELAVFLWRKKPLSDDLTRMTMIIRRFLDRVKSYPGFSRELCEVHRNQE